MCVCVCCFCFKYSERLADHLTRLSEEFELKLWLKVQLCKFKLWCKWGHCGQRRAHCGSNTPIVDGSSYPESFNPVCSRFPLAHRGLNRSGVIFLWRSVISSCLTPVKWTFCGEALLPHSVCWVVVCLIYLKGNAVTRFFSLFLLTSEFVCVFNDWSAAAGLLQRTDLIPSHRVIKLSEGEGRFCRWPSCVSLLYTWDMTDTDAAALWIKHSCCDTDN